MMTLYTRDMSDERRATFGNPDKAFTAWQRAQRRKLCEEAILYRVTERGTEILAQFTAE